MNKHIIIAGGGLAGVEAARQASRFGIRSIIYEMRPQKSTQAHKTSDLAELVCSNSLKSDSLENASGILKEEMRGLGSIVLEAASFSAVPAGKALAVDREMFSSYITKKIEDDPLIEIVREELKAIPDNPAEPLIIASGPLTSDALSAEISRITDSAHLYFYDSISPIVDADSLDREILFRASRYEKNETGDYLNAAMNKEQYYSFVEEMIRGEKIELHEFEKAIYFESCMPVEVMCERGVDTLRFGPMKPVGITDPETGRRPFAVVQLRAENKEETMYNIVGFQTKLRYPEQRRIFRMIPGLKNAEFLRYGSIHRNTYINSPALLNLHLRLRNKENIYFAGQITGVEGYIESAATGIIAGINASRSILGKVGLNPHVYTSMGSLLSYITDTSRKKFQPMNINFGLYAPLDIKAGRFEKKKLIADRALEKISEYKPYD